MLPVPVVTPNIIPYRSISKRIAKNKRSETMTMLLYMILAISGFIVIVGVATKSKLFWPALVVLAIATSDLMVQQYAFVDQFFISCIIFSALLSILIRKASLNDHLELKDRFYTFHTWIFNIMILYMIVQSTRGMIELESLRKIRWVVYYGSLGVLSFLVTKKAFPLPNLRKFALIVSYATIFYVSEYLILVLVTEIIYGTSRWVAQLQGWGGGAFSFFPIAVAMPATVILISDQKKNFRTVGWISLAAMTFTAFVSERRMAWIPIIPVVLILVLIFLRKFRIKQIVLLSLTCVLVLTTSILMMSKETLSSAGKRYSKEFYATLSPIWNLKWMQLDSSREIKDLDRLIHLHVALEVINDSWVTSLFGYGFRVSGFKIGPHLAAYYRSYLPQLDINKEIGDVENASTPGIPALFVETGYVGIVLLLLNFFLVGLRITVRKNNSNRWILLFSLFVLLVWLLANNMLTYILFYLAVMPGGILLQLSRSGTMKTIIARKK